MVLRLPMIVTVRLTISHTYLIVDLPIKSSEEAG